MLDTGQRVLTPRRRHPNAVHLAHAPEWTNLLTMPETVTRDQRNGMSGPFTRVIPLLISAVNIINNARRMLRITSS
jgi:hypothetical protein